MIYSPQRWTLFKPRISSIDTLRGFALLGILIMNIQSFGLLAEAYINPNLGLSGENPSSYDWLSYCIAHLFADQKFMSIFSILFGSSLALQYSKNCNRIFLLKRQLILFIIGLSHAYLLWPGDILVTYALCGSAALCFISLPERRLITVAALLFVIPIGIATVNSALVPFYSAAELQELQLAWQPSEHHINQQVFAMTGSWWQQLSYRVPAALEMQLLIFPLETSWRVLALMLLGIVLYRQGFYTYWTLRSYQLLSLFGFLCGLLLVAFGLYQNHQHQWQVEYVLFSGSRFNYLGSVIMAVAYASLVIFICRKMWLPRIQQNLASVGRLALSNYLLQSLICSSIFYGHGGGLFNSLTRTELWILLPPIWFLQVWLSKYYLSYFKQGPAEWLWRYLSKKTITHSIHTTTLKEQ